MSCDVKCVLPTGHHQNEIHVWAPHLRGGSKTRNDEFPDVMLLRPKQQHHSGSLSIIAGLGQTSESSSRGSGLQAVGWHTVWQTKHNVSAVQWSMPLIMLIIILYNYCSIV